MPNNIEDNITRILARLDGSGQHDAAEPEPGTTIPDLEAQPKPSITLHVHHFTDAIVFTAETEEPHDTTSYIDAPIPDLEAKPLQPQQQPTVQNLLAYVIVGFFLLLVLSALLLQLYFIVHPIIATVYLLPNIKQVSAPGSLHIVTGSPASHTQLVGRELRLVTLTQTATTPATGIKHQNAAHAHGYLTFYNGQYTTLTVSSDTIFTGRDGVLIQTDQNAVIPPASPPYLGSVTVSAHARNPGSSGNIAAYDINLPCCFTAVKVQNTSLFTGGQDEADFTVVTQKDIDSLSQALQTAITQSMGTAILSQQMPGETLVRIPCSPNVSPSNLPGDEASHVKVIVSETCAAIAYDTNRFHKSATDLLTQQAQMRLGSGYSLLSPVQITEQQTHVTAEDVTLTFTTRGKFVYQIPPQQEQRIQRLIAGKPKQEAVALLLSMPGIQQASIAGIEDLQDVPKNRQYIHLVLIVPTSQR